MYLNDKITKAYLKKAVKVGWITEEEYELIVEEKEKITQEKELYIDILPYIYFNYIKQN